VKKYCLVITTIHDSSNEVLQYIHQGCKAHQIELIIAGDKKTPGGFKLSNSSYLSVAAQKKLPFTISKKLPYHAYSRKNLGYLQAIKNGYEVIIETDDDNLPLAEFWDPRNKQVKGLPVEQKGWVNVYRFFSDLDIWPRGFNLQEVNTTNKPKTGTAKSIFCPIQQSLANENPDVDAIYRLTRPLPVYFKSHPSVILKKGSICPFNSQNTTWFKEAFPLLYLPSYCEFRMTDIWRSFVAQRILWANDWALSFHTASVNQKRNPHNLFQDFEEESGGYVYNGLMVQELSELNLKKGEQHIPDNLRLCYKLLVEKGYLKKKELPLLDCWLTDLEGLRNSG